LLCGAIEFGDLSNKDSNVLKLKASNRNDEVLKYLNTRPRTSYLARIPGREPQDARRGQHRSLERQEHSLTHGSHPTQPTHPPPARLRRAGPRALGAEQPFVQFDHQPHLRHHRKQAALPLVDPVHSFGALTGLMAFCFVYLISTGVGVWGQKRPVAWAWDITNFVFWIGIGHAGTLISASLFLTRQQLADAPVNRAAEAMTLCSP